MSAVRPVHGVYVAASSSELDRATSWMFRLENAGVIVTSTWPAAVQAAGSANPRDASRADRARWSEDDLLQVRRADLLWLLVPSSANGRGAYLELGYALGLGRRAVASGDTKQSIFTGLTEEFATDDEAFVFVCALARPAAVSL